MRVGVGGVPTVLTSGRRALAVLLIGGYVYTYTSFVTSTPTPSPSDQLPCWLSSFQNYGELYARIDYLKALANKSKSAYINPGVNFRVGGDCSCTETDASCQIRCKAGEETCQGDTSPGGYGGHTHQFQHTNYSEFEFCHKHCPKTCQHEICESPRDTWYVLSQGFLSSQHAIGLTGAD